MFLAAGLVSSQELATPLVDDLPRLLAIARDNNPELAAAREGVRAAREDYRLALAIPDPKVSAGYFISEVETRVGPQRAKVGASQMIPWPGKLAAKRKVAKEKVKAAQQKENAVWARLTAQIRSTYASLYATGRAVEINTANLELLEYMESVLLAKYAAAVAKQRGVLKLQVEAAVLEDKIESLEAQGVKLREKLRALLGGSLDVRLMYPNQVAQLHIADVITDLEQRVLDMNPALRAEAHTTLAAEARIGLARQAFAPDFMLMTDYMLTDESESAMVDPAENGKDPWVIGVSATVPIWLGTKNSRVRKAGAMRSMQARKQENMENSLVARAAALRETYLDAQRKVALFDSVLVPKARQTLALVQDAYANTKASVLDFLDAQRMLMDLEVALARLIARRETVAGRIDMLTGSPRQSEGL